MEMIRDLDKFDEIHDLGCGTGHCLELIARNSLALNGKSFGYDISETACKKAANTFLKSTFATLDLTQQATSNKQQATACEIVHG